MSPKTSPSVPVSHARSSLIGCNGRASRGSSGGHPCANMTENCDLVKKLTCLLDAWPADVARNNQGFNRSQTNSVSNLCLCDLRHSKNSELEKNYPVFFIEPFQRKISGRPLGANMNQHERPPMYDNGSGSGNGTLKQNLQLMSVTWPYGLEWWRS